jgi:hypothetical protein
VAKRRWKRSREARASRQTAPRANAVFDPALITLTPARSFIWLEEPVVSQPSPFEAWAAGDVDGSRCVPCGRVWGRDADDLEDFAAHLESEGAPAFVVADYRTRAEWRRDHEKDARVDVRQNPLAQRQTDRLVHGRDRATKVVLGSSMTSFGFFAPPAPTKVGEEWSDREASAAAPKDPTAILDEPGPFEHALAEELSKSFSTFVDKMLLLLPSPSMFVGLRWSAPEPDEEDDPAVSAISASGYARRVVAHNVLAGFGVPNRVAFGVETEEEETRLERRRHGAASECPRHGPTRGGLCRKCAAQR